MGILISKPNVYKFESHDFGYNEAGLIVELSIQRRSLVWHRHTRATVAEIEAVVNRGERCAEETEEIYSSLRKDHPAKDKPPHWYMAQLIHYGFASTSNKFKARKILQSALEDDQLEVPPEILKLEHEFKTLYELSGNTFRQRLVEFRCTQRYPLWKRIFRIITGQIDIKSFLNTMHWRPVENIQLGDVTGNFCIFVSWKGPSNSVDAYSYFLNIVGNGDTLCGSFHIGSKKGQLRLSHIPAVTNEFVPFEWFSQDDDPDAAIESGTGQVAFFGEGYLIGVLNDSSDIEFAGTQRA